MFLSLYKKFIWSGLILLIVLVIGTIGYWFIGGKQNSFVDTLYMTVITVTTIGFGEIVDLSGNPAGRIFTIFIAVSGIGILTYVVTNITGLVVEGELTESFRRRRMEKIASKYRGHYIVCGLGSTGFYIVNELHATKQQYVVLDLDENQAKRTLEPFPNQVFIQGDATDSETLIKAGIGGAGGLFAVTGDDNHNLVISLTAKQLNPDIKVVARCQEIKNSEKMKKAGADSVVSPTAIGGLRMASEMIRPTVVSFLDIMLRDKEKNLRVEEVAVPLAFTGKDVSALNLKKYSDTLLLAVKTKNDWIYNPPSSYIIVPDSTLVIMTTPEGRRQLREFLQA